MTPVNSFKKRKRDLTSKKVQLRLIKYVVTERHGFEGFLYDPYLKKKTGP